MSRQSTLFSFFSPRSQKGGNNEGNDQGPPDEKPSSSCPSTPQENAAEPPRPQFLGRSKSYPEIRSTCWRRRELFRFNSDGHVDKMESDQAPVASGSNLQQELAQNDNLLKRPHHHGDDAEDPDEPPTQRVRGVAEGDHDLLV